MSNSQIERILEGSSELFLQAGIKSVTMDDIAKHLGMSKKTIYQFFKDKNELVTALIKQRLQDDEDEMTEMLNKSGNVIEGMINMMKCSEEIFARANPIVIHDLQKYHPEAWKVFQEFKAGVIVRTLEELLGKGIKQGFIRPELDVKVLARMRMMQVEAGFNVSIFPLNEFNPWQVQREMMEHFNYGICTIKGYKLLNEYKNIHAEV
jgi:TetR/AcrR family transcriptional regulator, cholesterol catabolism regulator